MGSGAYADLLSGECIRKNVRAGYYGDTNIVFPFRQVSVYTIIGTVGGTNQEASTCACGKNTLGDGSPATDKDGTQALPVGSLPSTTYSRGARYGRLPASTVDPNNNSKILTARSSGNPVHFKTAEFEPWRKRSKYFSGTIGGSGYRTFASGPPLKHGILCMSLRRRLKRKESPNNRDYKNRMGFDFVDASEPVYGQSDWLGPMHPAHYFWTNESVPEPFLAQRFYEDSGAVPNTDQESAFKWHIPFCSPMPVYDGAGVKLGSYTGYTMQHYFSLGFIHFGEATNWTGDPNKPGSLIERPVFLPDDYRAPVSPVTGKPVRKVMLREQFFSLSSHLFMTSDNPQLGSPRIASARYWWYNDGTYANEPWINKPYLCGFVSPMLYPGGWDIPMEFNILDAGGSPAQPERMLISLEPMSTYLTA